MRSVLVTGGTTRLGLAIAGRLRSSGWRVVTSSHRADAGADLVADLSDPLGAARLYAQCLRLLGGNPPDALVNNACLSRGGLENCGWDDFNYVLRVGVSAPFYLTQRLRPAFAPGASIVNIASTRAFMSQANTESYTAGKGGIAALTHGLSVTLAGQARVN